MANPKRRKSKSKQKMRQFSNRWKKPQLNVCGECGTPVPGHTACPSCGYYRGRQVLSVAPVAG
ncbi:MAG: 50S ribosomal protein L32 [Verrucomicrobiaceae bacterium]|jgi:large subunit ribosomal protein L32|nr:50S ribosomal protein L32 [Verrucomicrobiaceae bacterium]